MRKNCKSRKENLRTKQRNTITQLHTSVENNSTEQDIPQKRRALPNQEYQETCEKHKTLLLLKKDLRLIKKWKNREFQIPTDEIRENADNRNMRKVWQRINQLKNQPNSNQKRTGSINEDGELKVRTPDVRAVMSTEIKNISTKLKLANVKGKLK